MRTSRSAMLSAGVLFALPILLAFQAMTAQSGARARPCGADVYASIRGPVSAGTPPIEVACDLTLGPDEVIAMPLAFSGEAASGSVLDCRGATLDGTVPHARTILIRSLKRPDGSWNAPKGITIRNCVLKGDLRIQGFGPNGEAEEVRLSSLKPGHTERAQIAAPQGITIDNVTFVANGGIPLYAAPGVTEMTVSSSRFIGKSSSTIIYLDAESARNRIIGNSFSARPDWREVIAVDGSAGNRIENNTFENPQSGGIFVYRNCGEGGTIRHQAPQGNLISGNTFRYGGGRPDSPAIWIGSRQGISKFNVYCLIQPGMIGDSFAHKDRAEGNTVTGNRLPGGSSKLVVDDGKKNVVSDNR